MREIERPAHEFEAESRLKAHRAEDLAEDLGQDEAEELRKALDGGSLVGGAFWQAGRRDGTNEDEKSAHAKNKVKYKPSSLVETAQVIALRKVGHGIRQIAEEISRKLGTVSSELRRFEKNKSSLDARYDLGKAHNMYKILRKHCRRKSVLTQDIIDTIYYLLSKHRISPEHISKIKFSY